MNDAKLMIGEKTRFITLQFSFSNAKAVPAGLRELPCESRQQNHLRKAMASGELVIKPSSSVSLFYILDGVKESGYELVDAVYQTRPNPRDSSGRTVYHMVRFVFLRRELVGENEDFRGRCALLYAELMNMCLYSLWRVRGFRNPCYHGGELVPDAQAVCLNFEAREPLTGEGGKPVLVWERDENHHKVGTEPKPLKATSRLVIQDKIIEILPV